MISKELLPYESDNCFAAQELRHALRVGEISRHAIAQEETSLAQRGVRQCGPLCFLQGVCGAGQPQIALGSSAVGRDADSMGGRITEVKELSLGIEILERIGGTLTVLPV